MCCRTSSSSRDGRWQLASYLSPMEVRFLARLQPLVCCLFVTVRAIYAFYKRQQCLKEIMAYYSGLGHGRYLRLMILSSLDLFGSIPLSTFYIVRSAKTAIIPWKSWKDTHENYSHVYQVPKFIWKNDHDMAQALEMYRWSLVWCAFLFFAFFGLAEEARHNYRRAFTFLASRIGYLTSSDTDHFGADSASSHPYVFKCACLYPVPLHSFRTSSPPNIKKEGGVTVHTSTVTTSGESSSSPTLSSDQRSINDRVDFELKIGQYLQSVSIGSSSVGNLEPELHAQSTEPVATALAVPSTSIPPLPDTMNSTIRAYSGTVNSV
jgi:pheromone a factor receptor